jgi:hypothetical protein
MVSVIIESCCLTGPTGKVSVTLRSPRAFGGDSQAFVFDEDALAWNRVGDMRHVLSRYVCTIYIF